MIKIYKIKYNVTGKYSLLGTFPLILYFLLFNANKNMRTISLVDLSDGTYVKTYPLDKEEFDLLSRNAKDFFIDEYECEIFVLDNGEVLRHYLKGYSSYNWYQSYSELRRLINDFPRRKSRHHFFEGYNPYQKHFPNKTKELIKDLFNDLGLNTENIIIDNSLISRVDKAIQYQDDPHIFMITHILQIIALVGEVFLSQNQDAEWYMDRDADGETWMPMIKINRVIDKTGTIGFVHWLYEDMMHYSGHGEVLLSSYLSLNDFSSLNFLTPEKGANSKLKVIDGKINRD